MRERFLKLIQNKHVHIATHWDCDGVSSGAILYHICKQNGAKTITTTSKGEEFLVYERDTHPDADIIICSDIQPSPELDPNKVIYIDHHPIDTSDQYLLSIHNTEIQSCSLLIWEKLIPQTQDPYLLFLSMLGYYGDSGKTDELPIELYVRAKDHFPQLLTEKPSFGGGTYNAVQSYVSMFNTGKRMHWNGLVPLELLKQISTVEELILKKHPLVDELNRYKLELRSYYNRKVDFTETNHFQYAIIECDKNIQGVICSRYLKEKPTIVINKYKQNGIASMRVPDHIEFDAGSFLSKFKEVDPDIIGGGHEKAGGITFKIEQLDKFIAFLESHTPHSQ